MSARELWSLAAHEQARLIREQQVTSTAVVRSVLDRIRSVDARIEAFEEIDHQGSLAAARRADAAVISERRGPLYGVPVSVKDLHDVRGMRTRQGSAARPVSAQTTSEVAVARLARAGAIIIGKTSTSEQGHSYSSVSGTGRVSRSPWNIDSSAGGSSGGAAAAVAAGMGSLGLGSDGAGSIRIPAALCGVVGLKPSLGRVPMLQSDGFTFARAQIGPLARTVEDAAMFLRTVQGSDPQDPLSWSPPAGGVGEQRTGKAIHMVWSDGIGTADGDPEVIAIARSAAVRLASALDVPLDEQILDWGDVTTLQRGLWECSYAMRAGGPSSHPSSHSLKDLIARGSRRSLAEFGELARQRTILYRTIRAFFEGVDILATPTYAEPGWPAHEQDFTGPDGMPDPLRGGGSVHPFNLSGNPAISVPAGWTAAGAPVGLQLVAGWRRDDELLHFASVFEEEQPWAEQWPHL